MMKTTLKTMGAAFALFALALVSLAGCNPDYKTSVEEKKTANLVYVNWAEGVAYTNVAEVVLEEKMGYDVTITAADVGPAYTSVAQGDQDAFMESWLPTLHKPYVERFKDQLVDLGYVYENTRSGLVVPAYVTIDSIAELKDARDKFDGEIVGVDAGAGIMSSTEEVIKAYDLDYKLLASSGPAMTAALQEAIQKEEWIVITGWKPHWMFGRWDLKFLKQDEDKTIWKKGNIHIMGRKNLPAEKPELVEFLKNMYLTDPELADLMLKIKNSEKPVQEIARQWVNENPQVVDKWIPGKKDAGK